MKPIIVLTFATAFLLVSKVASADAYLTVRAPIGATVTIDDMAWAFEGPECDALFTRTPRTFVIRVELRSGNRVLVEEREMTIQTGARLSATFLSQYSQQQTPASPTPSTPTPSTPTPDLFYGHGPYYTSAEIYNYRWWLWRYSPDPYAIQTDFRHELPPNFLGIVER